MYNLDAYIADFLAEHKKLSAQGLGEFTIVDGQAANGAPIVNFVSNKAAYTTEELISFIAEHQGKNKIVTGFDVESHFNQIKQFINIGTPWVIPGFGQLKLGRNRELEFVQEVPNENALHERIKHKQAAIEAHQTFDAVNPAPQRSNTGAILLTLVIVLGLGVGGYYFYANNNSSASSTTAKDSSATVTDTVVQVPSSSNINNTTTNTQPPQTNNPKTTDNTVTTSPPLISTTAGATGFRFVLNKTANAEYARKRYSQLKAYGTPVYIDSVKRDSFSIYKIYLRNNASPSDTAKLRDSLTRYYGKPVKVEVGQ